MGKVKKEHKEKKEKKEKVVLDLPTTEATTENEAGDLEWDKNLFISKIAQPLATPKLSKKLLKLANKVHKHKRVARGVKEVVKAIRKGKTGVCLIAGNISPDDVISHLPILCEDNNIAYCFVPSRESLGAAVDTKRSTSVILVQKGENGAEENDKIEEGAKNINELVKSI
ncbi:L30e-like protein [Neoconidiobolus thromboides FSU 785]|nr:L30e-like protein [Neoconidiobolus thromboides FSU 785]